MRITNAAPVYIDPAIGTDRTSSNAQNNLYDPLVKLGMGGEIIPWLATNWSYSPDGLTWNFTIRKGVKFHDGSEVTAEDVAFSVNRLLRMGTGRAFVISPYVMEVVAIDKYTAQFRLKTPFGPLVSALNGIWVLNKKLVMQNIKPGEYGEFGDYGKAWLTTNDAGSGPYKVKKLIMGEKLIMEKFKDYWAGFADKAPDIVEILLTTEPVTVRTMMSNKELEYSDPWQPVENYLAMKKIPGVKVAGLMSTMGGWYLMINTKKPPTDDVYFRRALAYCFNYTKVVTELFPGAVQMRGPVNSAMMGWDPDLYQFDINFEKAREMLSRSKYAENYTKYEVELHWVAEVPDEEKVAMMFMADAAKVGINIKVVKVPWTTMVQNSGSMETTPHISYISAGGTYPEAGSILTSRYHSSNAKSWMSNEWLLDEKLDAMIEEALKTLDPTKRREKYIEIQRYIVDLCPTIFMYQSITWIAYPDYVEIPWVKEGKYLKTAHLGDVYEWTSQVGGDLEIRLFKVDREIEYGG
jgi:peptide/nickel transport system substrate-binding protein